MRHILPTRSSLGGSGRLVMSWGQWMMVSWTIEEELQLEAQSRSALHHHDDEAVRNLCASLIKQNAYYTRLLKQATGHIAELEMSDYLRHYQAEPADGIVFPLPDATAGDAKLSGNLALRFLRRVVAMIRRHNMPIPLI